MKERVFDLKTFKNLLEKDYALMCSPDDVRFIWHIRYHEDGRQTVQPILSVPIRRTHTISGQLMEHVLYCELKKLHYLAGIEKEKAEKFRKEILDQVKKVLGFEPKSGKWEP